LIAINCLTHLCAN